MRTDAERFASRTAVTIFGSLCLIAVTLIVFVPGMGNRFVLWDLEAYRHVLSGTDYLRTSLALFTDFSGEVVSGYYAPLSSISLMLDKALTGRSEPWPWFTLLINVLIHCVNGVLVFLFLRQRSGAFHIAFIAALIFLLHPLQVQSVLWFAQRKGLLTAAFYLGAFLAYVGFLETGKASRYCISMILFVPALLCKPTAIVLPAVLAATVLLPRESILSSTDNGGTRAASRSLDLIGLIPFLGLAAIWAFIVVSTESPENVVLPLWERPFIAATALWFYLGKCVLPLGLSPAYPLWDVDPRSIVWWIPIVGIALATIAVMVYRRILGREFLWASANFLVPLLPVLGLVEFAFFHLSYVGDHFMYLPMVGFAYGVVVVVEKVRNAVGATGRTAVTIGLACWIAFLGVSARHQTEVWRSSPALWSRAGERVPESWKINTFLGHSFMESGNYDSAIRHFARALHLKEQRVRSLKRQSEPDPNGAFFADLRADKKRRQAELLEHGIASAHYNLGNALLKQGNHVDAEKHLRRATELDPTFTEAFNNLGICLLFVERPTDAVKALSHAVSLDPDSSELRFNLAAALHRAGREAEARREMERGRGLKRGQPGSRSDGDRPGP